MVAGYIEELISENFAVPKDSCPTRAAFRPFPVQFHFHCLHLDHAQDKSRATGTTS